jgi:UDP-2,3-diacylglucosamine pyrophosphatase LpxH
MPDIRYVVLSDLHLGAENSILTNLDANSFDIDTSIASPVLVKMVDCLRDIILKNVGTKKPTLILNGDIIELALTTTNNASMAFERFMEQLVIPETGEPLFDSKVYFLAGNHDHNLWERSRHFHYIEYLKTLKKDEKIREAIHHTDMFDPIYVPENLMNALIERNPKLKDIEVWSVYPAYGVLSENKQKCVIFCHGHYVESMYSLMTNFRSKIFPNREAPQSLQELEKENYAWVDFFWSTLGRSGSVGKDINLIYDKMQDPEEVKIMIHNLAEGLTANRKNVVRRWLDKEILEEILHLTLGRMAANERNEPAVVLTPEADAGLKILMERFIRNQLLAELDGILPENVSFIFGHTHKPFQDIKHFENYDAPVKVYNSGGWVVDTMHPQPLHGGSVVLVDEHFDTIALQMYKEGKHAVTLEELKDVNEKSCDFYERVNKLIDMQSEPWSGFAALSAAQVDIRYKNLATIAKSDD